MTEALLDIMGTARYVFVPAKKGSKADPKYELDIASVEVFGRTLAECEAEGKKPNPYVSIPSEDIGVVRQTLRGFMYTPGIDPSVKGFTIGFQVVDVERSAKGTSASTGNGDAALSAVEMRELLTSIGDNVGLAALFKASGLNESASKRAAKLAIAKHEASA